MLAAFLQVKSPETDRLNSVGGSVTVSRVADTVPQCSLQPGGQVHNSLGGHDSPGHDWQLPEPWLPGWQEAATRAPPQQVQGSPQQILV